MRILQNAIVSLLSVAVTLALCETGARLFLPDPRIAVIHTPRGFEEALESERSDPLEVSVPGHPSQGPLYVHSRTGRRLRANTRVVIEQHHVSGRRIEVRTNSVGYRNPEIRGGDSRRILFLGDSITFADFVDESETYVRLVEVMARRAGESWETINAGVGGVSLKNEIAILEETGLDLEPDVVVVGFYLNDFQESPGVFIPRLPPSLAWSRLATHILLRLALLWADDRNPGEVFGLVQHEDIGTEDLIEWGEEFASGVPVGRGDFREVQYAFNHLVLYNFADWGGAWSPHVWERMRPLFAELGRLSKEHEFALRIVAFPVRYQVEAPYLRREPQEQLQRIAGEFGIPLLDLLPVLRAAYGGSDGALYYDHCHLTPGGYRVVAAEVLQFLRGEER